MSTKATQPEPVGAHADDAVVVPAGYKRTEVGVIPEAWEVLPISQVSQNIIDYRGRTPRKLGMDWGGGGIPALSARNVKMGYINFEDGTYFGSEALYKRWMTSGDAKKNDIVITTEAPLGNVALIPDNRKYILSQRTILLKINPERGISGYLFQVMMSQAFQNLLSANSTGSTATGIQRKRFEKLTVSLPPPPEQREIAGALSDVDELIGALDKLVAKKRAIKKAAMQQLLTGKTRLPGFEGGWETKSLGELCASITDGTHFTPRYVADGVPFYSVENVTGGNFNNPKFISVEEHSRLIKRCKPEKDNILLTRIGALGDTKLIDWDIDASIYVSLALLKMKGNVDARYLYCYTKSRQFVEDLEARSLVNASPKKINMGDIGSVPVPAPQVAEQRAIAAVLSDMDAEIAALERRRDKTKAIKPGMMQALLTGRIRLVKPGAKA